MCSEGVKGDALVPPLNMVDFFRERQQAGRHGGASYGMGWLVKDILHEFCTSADDVIGPAHLNSQSIRAKCVLAMLAGHLTRPLAAGA